MTSRLSWYKGDVHVVNVTDWLYDRLQQRCTISIFHTGRITFFGKQGLTHASISDRHT